MNQMGPINARKDELQKIADLQYGYFTAHQAISCGYIKCHHYYHVSRQNWEKIDPGLFRLPNHPDSMAADFTKWHLWSRNQSGQPQAIISHDSALALHGLREYDPAQIHLTVPLRFRKSNPAGVVLHKASLNLSAIEPREGFMVATLAKTLEDSRPLLAARGTWESTMEQALKSGRLTLETARQLGFTPPAGALLAVTPDRPETEPEPPAQNSAVSIPGGATVPVLPPSAQMKERIYDMIFQRTRALPPRNRQRAQAGFTLVELLVVMSIISVMAAMLLPVLDKALSSAYTTACLSNHKQFGLALNMYLANYNNRYPSDDMLGSMGWGKVLPPYLDDPSSVAKLTIGQKYKGSGCPADRTSYWAYAFNFNLRFQPGERTDDAARVVVCSGASNYNIFPHTGTTTLLANVSSRHSDGYNVLLHGLAAKWMPHRLVNATDPEWEKPWWVDGFPH